MKTKGVSSILAKRMRDISNSEDNNKQKKPKVEQKNPFNGEGEVGDNMIQHVLSWVPFKSIFPKNAENALALVSKKWRNNVNAYVTSCHNEVFQNKIAHSITKDLRRSYLIKELTTAYPPFEKTYWQMGKRGIVHLGQDQYGAMEYEVNILGQNWGCNTEKEIAKTCTVTFRETYYPESMDANQAIACAFNSNLFANFVMQRFSLNYYEKTKKEIHLLNYDKYKNSAKGLLSWENAASLLDLQQVSDALILQGCSIIPLADLVVKANLLSNEKQAQFYRDSLVKYIDLNLKEEGLEFFSWICRNTDNEEEIDDDCTVETIERLISEDNPDRPLKLIEWYFDSESVNFQFAYDSRLFLEAGHTGAAFDCLKKSAGYEAMGAVRSLCYCINKGIPSLAKDFYALLIKALENHKNECLVDFFYDEDEWSSLIEIKGKDKPTDTKVRITLLLIDRCLNLENTGSELAKWFSEQLVEACKEKEHAESAQKVLKDFISKIEDEAKSKYFSQLLESVKKLDL